MNRKQRKAKLMKARHHSGFQKTKSLRVGDEVKFHFSTTYTSPPNGFSFDDVGIVVEINKCRDGDVSVLVSHDSWDGHNGDDERNEQNCWWFELRELHKI